MSERVIKTGLSKKYKDMLDAVIGQMSDGYWENTPMMAGYWKFVTTGTAGDEVTLEVDEMSGGRHHDRHIDNRFYGMSDDAVKKFFADKIKFLIKEEGLGKWDRGNESETDYLSYGKPRYRVKDCYYAYEILKGRYARKHPEYGDVAEAKGCSPKRERGGTDDDSIESRLVYVGRLTGEYSDGLAWDLASITRQNRRVRLRVIELLDEFDEAIDSGDDAALVEIAKDLKAFTDEATYYEGRKVAEAGTKVVSRFTVSDPDLDIDGQTIEDVLDKRFPMGDVFVRIIGKTKCEFRIEGEILKAIDIHWIERTIGAIAALEVNCRE